MRLNDRAQLDVGYCYHEVPKARWEAGPFPGKPIELGDFEGRYQSQSFALGLLWNFDFRGDR